MGAYLCHSSRTVYLILRVMVRGRLAPVAFLFEKRGLVKVALEQTDDLDAKVDQLVEAAMDADAEDFEQDEPDDGIVEVEVRSIASSW